MSQKGQGEKPPGGPPVPPPPRRQRSSVPPVANSGDVTTVVVPPPPMVERHRLESPTTTSRVTRPTSPSRKTIAPGTLLSGKNVPESSPSSPRRKSRPDDGTSQMTHPLKDATKATATKAAPQRENIRGDFADVPAKSKPDSGPLLSPVRTSRRSSLSPNKTFDLAPSAKETLQDAGPSTSAQVPQYSHRVSLPMSSAKPTTDVKASRRSSLSPVKYSAPGVSSQTTLQYTGPTTKDPVVQSRGHRVSVPMSSAQTTIDNKVSHQSSRSPVKTSDPVAFLHATPRDSGTSTTARGPQSSQRASLLTSAAQTTNDAKSASPRVGIQEARPSTSAGGNKMAATRIDEAKPGLKQRLFKKKTKESPSKQSPQEPPQEPHQQARRSSVVSTQNKVKTTRILYSTEEEVRAALIEFTVFIIFLILTSLVTLSVRHSYMFYFNDTMKKLFTSRDLVIAPSVTVNFEKQITVPDWWDYLVYNFLITLHGDLTVMDGRSGDTTNTDQSSAEPGKESDEPAEEPTEEPAEEPTEEPEEERSIKKPVRRNSRVSWDPGEDSKKGSRTIREVKREAPPFHWGSMPVPKPGLHHRKRTSSFRQNTSNHHLEGRVFLYENLLLGPPRLRQIRVRKESCYVNDAFIRYFNSCYAAYSRSAEDRTVFQGIPYRTMSTLNTMPIWTVLAFYRTGGYVVDLTYVKNENLGIITDLKNNHWLDRGSRLCLVEFNLFNDNTDIFQSIKLIAEIPPTGGVIPQAHMQTVKQHSFFTDRNMVMSVIYIFWYIMVIYYTIYEINEIRKSGCKNYLFSIMNMLDCIILLLCYLALVYNIWHTLKISHVTTKAMEEFTYQSLDVLCFWNIIYVDMMAILAFLVWIKIFKFISFNKTLVQFTTTLKRCSKDLAGFSLMFGIVFLAYAQLGLLLFGTKHPDFRNFITSILTMIRMILGDFQYNLIEQANRVLGPIYFLTYILLVFFILLNMFLAIIMETYNTVKSEITHGSSQLGSYIYKKALSLVYFIIHCGRKRKAKKPIFEEVEEEAKEEPEVLHKNLTETEARYFQEIPPGENKELVRLTNRVSLLEEILEKLITNMDDILKRVEKEREHRKK